MGETKRKKKGSPRQARQGKWREATAGAFAGAVSRVVISPLDVIKIRFQIQREATSSSARAAASGKYRGVAQALSCIVREEGVVGLWRGTVPGLLLTVPYTAVQFFALETFKSAVQARRKTQDRTSESMRERNRDLFDRERMLSFVGGACAGVAATTASYPFDLLRTTMAAQGVPRQYPTMIHAARGIVAQRDLFRGMYAGLGATIVEIIPYAALQFGLYDVFTTLYQRKFERSAHSSSSPRPLSPSKDASPPSSALDWTYLVSKPFVCGLASGFIAKFATHPLDVVKKRYQVAGLRRSKTYGRGFGVSEVAVLGITRLLMATVREEGIKGIYKGVTPSLIKSAPSAAITFCVYSLILDQIKKMEAENS